MPFFSQSSHLAIHDGSFSEIRGDCFNISVTTQEPAAEVVTQLLGKRKERDSNEHDSESGGLRKRRRQSSRNEDGLMIVKADEVDLHRELVSGNSYRMHSASHCGRVVAVKVFEGPDAKQDWAVNVAFSKQFLHSNVLKLVGVSDETSKNPFVVFRGISEKRLESVIARALRNDLNTSVRLSMKAVKGLAAGLSYMRCQKIPIHGAITDDIQRWENVDIFAGDNDEPVIAIHPPSTIPEGGELVAQSWDMTREGDGLEALTGLCQKLFSAANSILYDDSPERDLEQDDTGVPTSPQDPIDSSDILETEATSPACSTNKKKLKRAPRREVWWRLDTGSRKRNLDSIARRFEDYLDCFLESSSLRRIRRSRRAFSRLTSHKCPGYLREEITLTSDVTQSAIISHEYPSQSELCSVCGQLVRYEPIDAPPLSPLVLPIPTIHGQMSSTNALPPFSHLETFAATGSPSQFHPNSTIPDVSFQSHPPPTTVLQQPAQYPSFYTPWTPPSGFPSPWAPPGLTPFVPPSGLPTLEAYILGFSPGMNLPPQGSPPPLLGGYPRQHHLPNNPQLPPRLTIPIENVASVDIQGNQQQLSKPPSPSPAMIFQPPLSFGSNDEVDPRWVEYLSSLGSQGNQQPPLLSTHLQSSQNSHMDFSPEPLGLYSSLSSFPIVTDGFEREASFTLTPNLNIVPATPVSEDITQTRPWIIPRDPPGSEAGGAPATSSSPRRKQVASFVCPVPGCGSTFTRHFNLKGHLRSHNEAKPYTCHWPGCGKAFARQHDCKRHEQLHTNYRPFECTGCGKVFARIDALNRHLRSEGGAECARADENGGDGGGVGGAGPSTQQQADEQSMDVDP